jgi:hypothetical protein
LIKIQANARSYFFQNLQSPNFNRKDTQRDVN